MKEFIKTALPEPVLGQYRRTKRRFERLRNAKRNNAEVFEGVYRNELWGSDEASFCSGSGSDDSVTSSYVSMVNRFIAENRDRIDTIVDIGCGDFRVGRGFELQGCKYIGIDVVTPLIDHLKSTWQAKDRGSRCLDATEDQIPQGELCLIRQVLQHLSNEEIEIVLRKTAAFRYRLITEHHPAPAVLCEPNLNKPHGGDTRVFDNSGVFIELPPFSVTDATIVLEQSPSFATMHDGEVLRTYLVERAFTTDAPAMP